MRFGYGFYGRSRSDLTAAVRSAEAFGYDTLVMPDHLSEQLSPVPALAAAALLTDRLRLATWVLCVDFHVTEVLARELATIDALSEGRLDIGLGAGWHRAEYDRAGIPFAPGPERFRRLQDAYEVIAAMLAGGPVTVRNDHHAVDAHVGFPVPARRPPIMLGGGGPRVLRWAAQVADIVSVAALSAPGGGMLASGITIEAAEAKLALVRDAAGARAAQLTYNVPLVDMVVTNDRRAAARSWSDAIMSGRHPIFVLDRPVTADDLLASPFFAFGTIEEIAEHVREVHARIGVDYIGTFPHLGDRFGPVVELLRSDS